jgi:tetratricopeptide (TPR) repeat protein
MALDPYAPCPCGSGKKLKFCECATESAELEKVMLAIEGDQRVAALELINRTLAQKPNQKSMLALKAMVQLQLRNSAEARKTSTAFLALAPSNPVALTLASFGDLEDDKPAEAIAKVQKAIAVSSRELHYLIPDALLAITQALVGDGKYLAARAHLLLRFSMLGEQEEDRIGEQLLFRLENDENMALVNKQDFHIKTAESSAPYATEFEAALEAARNGSWLTAAQHFEALDKKYPQQPAILYNLGVFQTYLADPRAAATWRRYASIPELSLDDAVDAELITQEMEFNDQSEGIDQIRIIYGVKDVSQLLESLTSEHRVTRMPVDLRTLVADGSPPPRAAYWLLDRAVPTESEGLTRDQVPSVVGDILVFGKETDREARLEFIITKTNEMVQKVRRLQEVGGDQLGMIEKEEKLGSISSLDEAMMTRWRLPEKTPEPLRKQLLAEQYRHNMFEVLPKLPVKLLGGKTAREVSADPQYRVRLLALIRGYELQYLQVGRELDFNELRGQLGLPPQPELDPTGVNLKQVPLTRLARYDVAKLNNEQIIDILGRCIRVNHAHAILRLCRGLLERNDLPQEFKKCDVYELLAKYERDPEVGLQHIANAIKLATEEGRSPARYLLSEFDFRLARGEVNEVQRIMTLLQSKYIREPGIAEALYMKLQRLGIINPDGSPRIPTGAAAGAPLGMEAAPASGGSGLWTPDGPAPASGGEAPSKLWLPGME